MPNYADAELQLQPSVTNTSCTWILPCRAEFVSQIRDAVALLSRRAI